MSLLFKQLLIVCSTRGRDFVDMPAFQGLHVDTQPVRVVTEPSSNAAFVYVADSVVGTVTFSAPLQGDPGWEPAPVPADAYVRVGIGAPGTELAEHNVDKASSLADLLILVGEILNAQLPAEAK